MNEFKKKRIEMGLSIIDVVDDLKYPIATIEAIERDEYNFIDQPYLYYCIKTYGSYLKIINLDDILKNIKKDT
ncbi:helix-turn-helix domain-containing protein [Alphaproteobacteria bacterium]|nr:helix-turn-helix domain-containing protein [Alphaproteobacteria bacterium]